MLNPQMVITAVMAEKRAEVISKFPNFDSTERTRIINEYEETITPLITHIINHIKTMGVVTIMPGTVSVGVSPSVVPLPAPLPLLIS